MTQEKWQDLLRILGVVLALLVMVVIAYFAYLWQNRGGVPQVTPEPVDLAVLTDPPAVLDRENLYCDADSFLRKWSFALETPEGVAVTLGSFVGKPLALTFFASYCPDCKEELAYAQDFADAAAALGSDFRLVARLDAGGRETIEASSMYLAQQGIEVPLLVDVNATVFETLGMHWIPTTLFFTADGMLMGSSSLSRMKPEEFASRMRYAQEGGAGQTERAIQGQLRRQDGGIAANFAIPIHSENAAPADEVLSETMGMMMEYALSRDDEQLFAECWRFVKESLTVSGLSPWRMVGGVQADTNAALDDIRILHALINAQARWGGDYREVISQRSDALYRAVVDGQSLVDHASLNGNGRAKTLTLCYVDLRALSALSRQDSKWAPIYERAKTLLAGGYISDEFPLYYPRFAYEQGVYTGSYLQMNESCVTLLHLAQAGMLPKATEAYLVEMLSRGPIYAMYDLQGNALEKYAYESTATYALLTRIGLELENETLTRLAFSRMERVRHFDDGSPLDGLYAVAAENQTYYTFDLLTVLQAWADLDVFLHRSGA